MSDFNYDLSSFRVDPRPQADVLSWAQKASALTGQKLANQKAQLEINSNRASSNALLGNTDRKTGQVNYAKARSAMAANPDAAYNAAENLSAYNAARSGDIKNRDDQISLSQHQLGVLAGLTAPLAGRDDLKKRDLLSPVVEAIRHKIVTPQEAETWYNGLPEDSKAIKDGLRGLNDAALGGNQAYADAYGSIEPQDVGGTIRFVKKPSPASGQTPPDLQKTLSPGEATAPVPVVNPDGSGGYTTRGQLASQSGQGQYVTGDSSTASGNAPWGDGRYPGAQGSNKVTPVRTSLAPGEADSRKEEKLSSTRAANELYNRAANIPETMAILQNMEQDQNGFISGPLRDKTRQLQALWNALPLPFRHEWNPEGIKDAESFNKFANQYALAQVQALGGSTNELLSTVLGANPNAHLQTDTNKMMIHQNMGLSDALRAKALAWQNADLPASQFRKWEMKFNQNFDPRAYQFYHLTKDELEPIMKEFKKSHDYPAYGRKLQEMKKLGIAPWQLDP